MSRTHNKGIIVTIACCSIIIFFTFQSRAAETIEPILSLLLLRSPDSKIIQITENITSDTTWETGYIYHILKYDFYVSATLTIEPGVIVKFDPEWGPYLQLDTAGQIIAVGTFEKPIVFTSLRDDAHGGDSNGDGNATTPAARDWFHIGTNGSTKPSIFSYCHFYYGGGGAYLSTLEVYDSTAEVSNCIFGHNWGGKSGDYHYGALDISHCKVGTTVTDTIFYGNILPLSICQNIDLDNSNIFHELKDPDDPIPALGNTMNGIYYSCNYRIDRNVAWEETEVAFVIDTYDLWVNNGYHLTLGNNVVLKFMPDHYLVLDDGSAALVNYNGPGVAFTSIYDDTRKGDTYGDGGSTSPAVNDWVGLIDNSGYPYYFNFPNIFYDSY